MTGPQSAVSALSIKFHRKAPAKKSAAKPASETLTKNVPLARMASSPVATSAICGLNVEGVTDTVSALVASSLTCASGRKMAEAVSAPVAVSEMKVSGRKRPRKASAPVAVSAMSA